MINAGMVSSRVVNLAPIYRHANGVTIVARPETEAGWYEVDIGDGLNWYLVVADSAALTTVVGVFKSDATSGEVFKNVTMYGETKSISMNRVVTSKTTNMGAMFYGSQFNQDISEWDVSNVTNMNSMFNNSQFNQDISEWDVSSVTNKSYMFRDTVFNGDISQWDVSNATNVGSMFQNSVFNQDVSSWCVENIQTEPASFALNSPLASLPDFKPKWGEPCITCGDGSKHHEDYVCGV